MEQTKRLAYLDWLRILAIVGVLFFHSAMAFTEEKWHIKNGQVSPILLEFISWLHRFRMPLLFFISGTVSYFMLQKRSSSSFIAVRFRRLFIPLIFGMLVIVPPQVYMERLVHGFKGSFWNFYPSIFLTGAYPRGNLSWHHLWFILYLLVYDIICAPVFSWLISAEGKQFLQRLTWMTKGKWVYLLLLPSVIIYTFFCRRFPETNDLIHDYAYLPYWLFFLLAGFICIANPAFMDSLERNRRFSFGLAFFSVLFINYLRWNDITPWDIIIPYRVDWRTHVYMAISCLSAWAWVFTSVGYGKRYLNKSHRSLQYLNQAVYPFYILHQTVIVVLMFYIVKSSDTILMKYLFTVITTFLISVSIYHLLIRPYKIMRFLFGAKQEKKQEPEPATTQAQEVHLLAYQNQESAVL